MGTKLRNQQVVLRKYGQQLHSQENSGQRDRRAQAAEQHLVAQEMLKTSKEKPQLEMRSN